MINIKKLSIISILLYGVVASAALPPRYQNANDLDVMIEYIKNHDKVITRLKSIDFRAYIVYYDECQIIFGRSEQTRPRGIVGPAAKLEYKETICK